MSKLQSEEDDLSEGDLDVGGWVRGCLSWILLGLVSGVLILFLVGVAVHMGVPSRDIGRFGEGLGLGLLALLLCALSIAFLVWMAREVPRARSAQHWPSVEGRITDSYVDEIPDSNLTLYEHFSGKRSVSSYRAVIAYEYVVDFRTHHGDTVHLPLWHMRDPLDFFSGGKTLARDSVAKFPTGTNVSVYYDPINPSRAVLDLRWSPVAVGIFGLGAMALALFAVQWIVRVLRAWPFL